MADPYANIGLNLAPMTDGSRAWAFADMMKRCRIYTNSSGDRFLCDSTSSLIGGMTIPCDANNYPAWASISPGTIIGFIMATDPANPGEGHQAPSTGGEPYILEWQQDGGTPATWQVRYSFVMASLGATTGTGTAPDPYQITFQNNNEAGTKIWLIRLLTWDADYPPHDIHCWYPGEEGNTFHSDYVTLLSQYKFIRTMDWTNANGGSTDPATPTLWADRPVTTQLSYADGRGVPWEDIIALANATDCDPCINIPAAANDEYVTALATLFQASLEGGRTVRYELANEMFNSLFAGYHYFAHLGDGTHGYGTGTVTAFCKRFAEISDLWSAVYGAPAMGTTILRLLPGQKGTVWFGETFARRMIDYNNAKFDGIVCSLYFGYSTWQPTAASTVEAVYEAVDAYWNTATTGNKAQIQAYVDLCADLSTELSRTIVLFGYEGGSHINAHDVTDLTARDTVVQYHRSLYIYQTWQTVLQFARDALIDAVCHYYEVHHLGRCIGNDQYPLGTYYPWGALEYMDQTPAIAYRHQAMIDAMAGTWWDAAALPDIPDAPTAIVLTVISATQIDVGWTDNADDETGFKVERSLDGLTWSQIGTVTGNVVIYHDTGLTPSTLYYYRVRAYNDGGNSTYATAASATTTSASTPTVPNPPYGITLLVVSTSEIDLAWSSAIAGVDGCAIERQQYRATSWVKVASVAAPTRIYKDTGLRPGTKYLYRLRTYNSVGYSAYSDIKTATTRRTPKRRAK